MGHNVWLYFLGNSFSSNWIFCTRNRVEETEMIKRIVDYIGHSCIGSSCCCHANPEAYGLVHWVDVVNEKCNICGSTAIDHTENQCSINRQVSRKRK